MRRLLALGAAASLLAGCTTPQVVYKIQKVDVPVSQPCKVDIGPEPVYVDNDSALEQAPDLLARVRLLVAGRLQRIARDAVKDAVLRSCSTP